MLSFLLLNKGCCCLICHSHCFCVWCAQVPHLNDLRNRHLERALKLLSIPFDLGGTKPAGRTKEAADIHLTLGNIKEYCSIMVELGEWERAIAIAPSHSIAYWQELSTKYAEELRAKGNDDVIPFYVATGQRVVVVVV